VLFVHGLKIKRLEWLLAKSGSKKVSVNESTGCYIAVLSRGGVQE